MPTTDPVLPDNADQEMKTAQERFPLEIARLVGQKELGDGKGNTGTARQKCD